MIKIIKNIFDENKFKSGTLFIDLNDGVTSNKIPGAIRQATVDIGKIESEKRVNFVWIEK